MLSKNEIEYTLTEDRSLRTHRIRPAQIICAGWSGRDQASVKKHIDELVALGVAAPKVTPILFSVTADLLTVSDHIDVQGTETSSEIEYVLMQLEDKWFVTVGSDHTDRDVERFSVEKSKQMCPKITARKLWALDDVKDHWDCLRLTSWVSKDGARTLYQDEDLAQLISYETLFGLVKEKLPALPRETPIFGGTIPTLSGLVFADHVEFQMHDPILGRTIRHEYSVRSLVGTLGL